VDNSIVAMEAIYTRLQAGESPRKAAVDGVQDIGLAISASTTTTLIVFLPLIFAAASESVIIMREFGIVLCLSISASLLVAFTLIPLLAALWGTKEPAKLVTPKWFVSFRDKYLRVVDVALRRRKPAILILVLMFALTIIPMALIENEYIPETAMRIVRILVRLDRARSLDEIDALVDKVESKLWAYNKEWGLESMTAFFNRDFIEINLFLPVYETPKMTRREVKERAKKVLDSEAHWPGVEYDMENMGFEGAPAGGIHIRVLGENPDVLYQVAENVRQKLFKVEGISEVKPINIEGEKEIDIRFDRDLATVYGVDPTLTAYEIAYGIRGTQAGWVQNQDRQVDVVLQLRKEDRENIPVLQNYPMRNEHGKQIPLGSFVSIGPHPIPRAIQRENRRTSLQVPIEYVGRDLFRLKKKIEAALEGFPMPRGYSWTMGDQFDKIRDAFITLGTAIALAIILVFIVMVAQFENFFLPFVIMFSMPFGAIGVYWALYLTGNTINILSGAGMLLLAGIVVNNAIVLVDHVNILRRRGESRFQSLMGASRDRLRPILMTAATTIVGLFPMAMGANDQGRMIYSPLAISVLGGMLTSTILIPIITPTLYSASDDVVIRLKNWYKTLKSAARV